MQWINQRLRELHPNTNICKRDFFESTIDHIQQWKMQEIWNLFHGENYLISKGFSNFEHTTPARSTLSSNVHQFCKPKSSCFMREKTVKRISFFLELFMLYEVYRLALKDKCSGCSPLWQNRPRYLCLRYLIIKRYIWPNITTFFTREGLHVGTITLPHLRGFVEISSWA